MDLAIPAEVLRVETELLLHYNLCDRTHTMAPYPPSTYQQAGGEGERVWGK